MKGEATVPKAMVAKALLPRKLRRFIFCMIYKTPAVND
jgi:hypothetical protein